MEIKELSQMEADDLLKTLQDRPNFEKTFQDEIDRKNARELTWALPQDDSNPAKARTYYVVIWDDNEPYLLLALVDISMFLRSFGSPRQVLNLRLCSVSNIF